MERRLSDSGSGLAAGAGPAGAGSGALGGSGGGFGGDGVWGEWSASARARDWVGTSQPWTRFVGWQGWSAEGEQGSSAVAASWSVPTTTEVGDRIAQNLSAFLSNYAVVSLVSIVYILVTHVRLLFWLGGLGAVYYGGRYVWNNRLRLAARFNMQLSELRLPEPIKPRHCTFAFGIAALVLFFYVVGHEVFLFVGITSTFVMSHATFRTPLSENPKKADGGPRRLPRDGEDDPEAPRDLPAV